MTQKDSATKLHSETGMGRLGATHLRYKECAFFSLNAQKV